MDLFEPKLRKLSKHEHTMTLSKSIPKWKHVFSYLQTHNKERFLAKLHYIMNTFFTVQAKNKTLFDKKYKCLSLGTEPVCTYSVYHRKTD